MSARMILSDGIDDLFADLDVPMAVASSAVPLARPVLAPAVLAPAPGTSAVTLLNADCLEALRGMPDNSVDSIVTDPPYGLAAMPAAKITETMIAWCSGDRSFIPEGAGFMGRSWDAFVPPPAVWDEALRVLKPGGYLLAFAGSRTQDLMGLSIRLAGFELRDGLTWNYGSGFPKSMDISKAIDKMHGAEREVMGSKTGIKSSVEHADQSRGKMLRHGDEWDITAPATPDAIKWSGWGTALKPAFEPIIMARKPLTESTVAANVLAHGTGGINIDASRIEHGEPKGKSSTGMHGKRGGVMGETVSRYRETTSASTAGRFPANVLFDDFTAGLLDAQSGITKTRAASLPVHDIRSGSYGSDNTDREALGYTVRGHNDEGGASRFFLRIEEDLVPFFYSAKAGKSERPVVNGVAHPTVKPLALMRYLIRLVTPPGGVVLEPFAGSGTTVEAAMQEGFDVIAVERDESYIPLIQARIDRQRGVVS